MELHDYVVVLRRRWLSATLALVVVLGAVVGYSLLATPRYTAVTRLFFSVQGTGSATDLAQGSTFAEKQMTSYAEVATSPLVLQPVIDNLALGTDPVRLAKSVDAVVPPDTVIVEISAEDVDPARAARIANAVGARLTATVSQLSSPRADGSQAVQATMLAPAQLPTSPSSPDLLRNIALGLALGLLVATAVALVRNVLDTKVRSEDAIGELTDTPVLGVIAFDEAVPDHPVILREAPRGSAAEAVRRLRTNLQFVEVADRSRVVVVSSSVPGEGKSTTAINLAVSLADAGSRVLLVDADLRRPAVADYLGLEGSVGLTTVLIGRADVEDVVQPWGDTTLDVLPAGRVPPNPSELLGSTAMKTLLSRLGDTYDLVLVDSPPLLPVTDAAVLGQQAGGVLLVVGVDRIHRPQLKESLDSLETAGCHLLGLVVNKIARREAGGYAYERGYYASATTETDTASDVGPGGQRGAPTGSVDAGVEAGELKVAGGRR